MLFMAESLRNRIDDAGRPICPVCGQSIKMTEIAIRADEWLVHFGCRDEPRKRAEPCDPSDPEA